MKKATASTKTPAKSKTAPKRLTIAQKKTKLTPVSEKAIKSSAARVTAQGSLVSAEIQFVINELGRSATQQQIDDKVIQVRTMKWADIIAGM